MKILALVPAYNEEKSIASVIQDLQCIRLDPHHELTILVINDGSKDSTSAVARQKKAEVVDLPVNLGIGGAVQAGFKFAIRYGYNVAFQFDGDGQHVAAEVEKILVPVLEGDADVVLGTRFLGDSLGYKSTRMRRFGIAIFKLLNHLIIHQRITDSTSGFRAYNLRSMRFLAEHYPADYPEPESLILLGKNGYRLKEVSVEMRERQDGISSISGIISLYYMVKVVVAILVASFYPKVKDKP